MHTARDTQIAILIANVTVYTMYSTLYKRWLSSKVVQLTASIGKWFHKYIEFGKHDCLKRFVRAKGIQY